MQRREEESMSCKSDLALPLTLGQIKPAILSNTQLPDTIPSQMQASLSMP